MPLIVKEQDVRDAGFTKGAGASWYFPNDNDNHIHLGASTGPGVGLDRLQINFVSIKIGGQNLGNLAQCRDSLKFDVLTTSAQWRGYRVPFQQALFNAGIGIEGC
jgi:hypothetical protein